MKAFIYTKDSNPKKIAVITDVWEVYVTKERTIHIVTTTGAYYSYDTKTYKTTIYQN